MEIDAMAIQNKTGFVQALLVSLTASAVRNNAVSNTTSATRKIAVTSLLGEDRCQVTAKNATLKQSHV